MIKLAKAVTLSALLVVVGAGTGYSQSASAWEPKKPVELIIMAGAGGGADQIARLLQG